MERLGIEEGEHIESSMVTRAVENAQKKVEAMHFESRKHLLEYDDVANKQRKVIYAFRNDLLNPEFDIGSKINENRVEYVNNLLINCEIFDGMPKEDFEYKNIIIKLKEELNLVVTQEDLASDDFGALHDRLLEILKTVYERKMALAASDQKSEIERILYLQILDTAWREHLYSMDTLKTGIGLRGYNQKDPLVEYKKESYNMFVELTASIKHEIIKVLFTVQLRNKEEEQREKEMLEKIVSNMEAQQENARTNLEEPSIEKKVARNEPCPCGSGKKYKQCCGISGPKKGLVAGH